MTIGTGIAIAGVWLFVGAAALSKTTTGMGLMVAVVIGFIVTLILK